MLNVCTLHINMLHVWGHRLFSNAGCFVFIWLHWVLVVAHRLFLPCVMRDLSCCARTLIVTFWLGSVRAQ